MIHIKYKFESPHQETIQNDTHHMWLRQSMLHRWDHRVCNQFQPSIHQQNMPLVHIHQFAPTHIRAMGYMLCIDRTHHQCTQCKPVRCSCKCNTPQHQRRSQSHRRHRGGLSHPLSYSRQEDHPHMCRWKLLVLRYMPSIDPYS